MDSARCFSTGVAAAHRTLVARCTPSEQFILEITPRLRRTANVMCQAREVYEAEEDRCKRADDEHRCLTLAYVMGQCVWVQDHTLSNAKKGVMAKLALWRDGPYVIACEVGTITRYVYFVDSFRGVLNFNLACR